MGNTLLQKVKDGLGITSNAQDETLKVYINAVKEYMSGAGVSEEVLDSDMVFGAVLIGVSDLWNYNSGKSQFSPYFVQRVIQLKNSVVKEDAND